MKPLTFRALIKVLESNGFFLARKRGSHHIYKNADGVMVSIPLHGRNKPIHIGTFLAIVKESRLPRELFES